MTTQLQEIASDEVETECCQCKLAVVGDHGVGKSALTVKYLTKRFINEYDPTLEDKYKKLDVFNNQRVSVAIMDTYDKESSRNPSRYLDWADGFVVVYSVTQRSTFDKAQNFLEMITQRRRQAGGTRGRRLAPVLTASESEPICVLVGNKIDLERYRQVSKVEGHDLSSQYDCTFIECSAAEEYDQVARVFGIAVNAIIAERENRKPLQPLYISEEAASHNTNNTELFIKDHYSPSRSPSTSSSLSLLSKPLNKPSGNSTPIFKLFNRGFKK